MKGSDIKNGREKLAPSKLAPLWALTFLVLTAAFNFNFLHLELESCLHASSEGASLAIIEFSSVKRCCENETFDSDSSSHTSRARADFPYHIWVLRLIYTSLIYICHQALYELY